MRLGILGLGQNWQSLRNVLRQSKVWTVAIVFDQVHHRAAQAVLPFGARVAESVWQFVFWPGVDAFIYCDSQWFGLWPLEIALQMPWRTEASGAGRPISQQVGSPSEESRTASGHHRPWLCFVPPGVTDAADQRVVAQLAEVGFPIVFDWPEWHTLPLVRLKRRIPNKLGRLLWASAEYLGSPNATWLGQPTTGQFAAHKRWLTRWLSGLIVLTQLTGSTADLLQTQVFRFDHETGGGILQLALHAGECWIPAQIRVLEITGGSNACLVEGSSADIAIQTAHAWQLRLVGEKGELLIRGPDFLEWHTRRGRVQETYPSYRSPWRISLRGFERWIQHGDWQPASLKQLARYCQQLFQLAAISEPQGPQEVLHAPRTS